MTQLITGLYTGAHTVLLMTENGCSEYNKVKFLGSGDENVIRSMAKIDTNKIVV